MGASRIAKLKQAGIETPLDLCCRFPYRYIDLSLINRFDLFSEGDQAAGCGRIVSIQKKIIRKNLSYVKAEFVVTGDFSGKNNENIAHSNNVVNKTGNNENKTGDKKFWATWFNQPFMSRVLKVGGEYFVVGRFKLQAGRTEISAPVLINPDKSCPIIPVYRSVGVPAAVLKDAIKTALTQIKIDGFLNGEVRQKYGLIDTQKAFLAAHFPKSLKEAEEARHSLSIENLAGFIALYHSVKKSSFADKKPHTYQNTANPLLQRLPFGLTDDQTKAYQAIAKQLCDLKPANILLEGDVGSGKTIVCLLAMSLAAQNGHQSVLMAPTEILARQHFLTAQKFFAAVDKQASDGLAFQSFTGKIEFLSGSQTSAQRAASLFNIENGNAKIIIGTHSVFGKDVRYHDLTLVITDEQQRFGVLQRGALENKSLYPDRLSLSATPIPRTLALTLYGELDLIALRQKPLKKARVFTRFVGEKVSEMYDYIKEKAENGQQTMIVCPRIQGDQELELTGAEPIYKQLKPRFGDDLGLLHGKMKDAEKIDVMDKFAAGVIKILVSTTIIEVGVDVPAATTMVIYNAERYGLCQLHQLRGRVGRGSIDSYCFLICEKQAYEARLKLLTQCEDGFLLAEKDFELRGAGDFLGLRQHGASLSFSGEPITLPLLKLAKQVSAFINAEDLGCSPEIELFFKELALN